MIFSCHFTGTLCRFFRYPTGAFCRFFTFHSLATPVTAHLDNQLTDDFCATSKNKRLSSLRNPPPKREDNLSRMFWVFQNLGIMKSTWICQLQLEEVQEQVLSISKREFGRSYRLGRKSYYQKLKGKYLVKLLFRPYVHIQ